MKRPIEWFEENGCELRFPERTLLEGIYCSTRGMPCNGCNCKDTCPAWPLVNLKEEGIPQSGGPETNAQIAERLGITKRQVSKRRKAGIL